MVLNKVLKQAGGDRCAEVRVGVRAPLPREAPHLIGVLLDMVSDTDDRLPPWVQFALRRLLAGENPLCFANGL